MDIGVMGEFFQHQVHANARPLDHGLSRQYPWVGDNAFVVYSLIFFHSQGIIAYRGHGRIAVAASKSLRRCLVTKSYVRGEKAWFLMPFLRESLPRRGRAGAPVGNRPANERSVVAPRRAIIIVDLAATRAIFPVPTLARVLRRPFKLLLGDIDAVPTQAGVIFEGVPGERIVVAANAQEATKLEHGIGHLAADLSDHDPLDGTDLLAFGVIDSGAFHFVAADEASSLPRFCCHWISPLLSLHCVKSTGHEH